MSEEPLLGPSAQPGEPDARVFGVQSIGPDKQRQVACLTTTMPMTADVLKLSGPAAPPEVFRTPAS
jgi:hypothetical protein